MPLAVKVGITVASGLAGIALLTWAQTMLVGVWFDVGLRVLMGLVAAGTGLGVQRVARARRDAEGVRGRQRRAPGPHREHSGPTPTRRGR